MRHPPSPHPPRLLATVLAVAVLCVVGLPAVAPSRAPTGAPTRAPAWAPAPAYGADDPSAAAAKKALTDPDPGARAAAVRRLTPLRDASVLVQVVAAMSDPHPYVRRAAAGVLGIAVAPEVRARVLREAPGWRDPTARREAARSFALWVDEDGRTGLLRLLADHEPAVRAEATRWLAEDEAAAAGEALLRATADPDGLVRASAFDAIAARRHVKGASPPPGTPGAAPAYLAAMRDRDPRVRLSALECATFASGVPRGSAAVASLGEGHETAVVAVLHGLDDAVWSVRLAAAELAGTVRDKRLMAPLVAALRDPRDAVARQAGKTLTHLTGIPFDAEFVRWNAWLEGDGAAFDPQFAPPHRETPFDPGGTTVAPVRILDMPVASSHVTFVLDGSGSMKEGDGGGVSRWDRLRGEVDRVLETLGTAAEGNVVVFSDEAKALFPHAERFSPSVRAKVHDALLGRAPHGRTALYDGVALALEDAAVDTVVLVSDGAPSAGQWFTKTDLRQEIARANRWRKARIDVVSIGGDGAGKKWATLLADLAKDNNGTFLSH